MNYNNKEDVVKDYQKFITFVLKSMNLLHRQDELFDVGMIGFSQGINSFDKKKGYKYSTYLYTCIQNEIKKVIDYENRPKRDVEILSLNHPVTDDEYRITEFQDLIPTYVNYEDKMFLDDVVRNVMRFLGNCPRRQEEIFKYIYGIDNYPQLTYEEIAKIFGTSRQAIGDSHRRLMKRIRNYLKKEGYYER